ncbi:cell division protein FtsQ/DivIB [Pajaroellobacter abortibovis]|uniref:POTRA domain-containing protein n=1 Tax=Pajaroellobacter abortibovis TaxID=1882918 RepID=A0A1L6MW73_9BACT|nr:FtsQ-type POTRA domain-containing protein [Pajaroellobacter abortibovis]APR99687.1 hypothetical protein BCY86_02610 [Pajaroellobacter abortibovis]
MAASIKDEPHRQQLAKAKRTQGSTNRRIRPPQWSVEGEHQEEKRAQKRRMALKVVCVWLGTLLTLGVALFAALWARRYVMESPQFAVETILVEGMQERSVQEIIQLADIQKGQNIFSIELEEIRQRVLKNPWITRVKAIRKLPHTIVLSVEEQEVGGIVALGDCYLVSRQGKVFKKLEPGDPTNLPVIVGLTKEMFAGDRLGAEQLLRRALDLAMDYEHGPLARRSLLQQIDISPNRMYTLIIGDPPIAVALGFPPFRRKIQQAILVFAELERRGARAKAIMLDNEARPEKVVVRLH